VADEFELNLLKVIAAQNFYLCGLQTAREMFGKSYFSLGISEKVVVDQSVIGLVGANFRGITPELLNEQKPQEPVGFQSHQVIKPEKT
jgi:hypothetical protein